MSDEWSVVYWQQRAHAAETALWEALPDAKRYRFLRTEIHRVNPVVSVVVKANRQRTACEWCNFASAEGMDSTIDECADAAEEENV